MAQLTDDCFAFGGSLMRIEDAAALIAERLPVLAGVEWVPLGQADGRIAAEAVTALHDVPPFANSAVDGYAVRHAALNPDAETTLPVVGRVAAGADPVSCQTGRAQSVSSPVRRCRRAPTPSSCRKTSAATATRSPCRPA